MAIGRSTILSIASLTLVAACDPDADTGDSVAPVVVYVGVARHAQSLAGARELIEWLSMPAIQQRYADLARMYPASTATSPWPLSVTRPIPAHQDQE
jgi:ABC-type Fe3+ transport system substrate-binding protein